MIRFAEQDLFSRGPSRLEIDGVRLRHISQPALAGRGIELAGQGQQGRSIIQYGTLRGTSYDALLAQRAAIEQMIDGLTHTLIDEQGEAWPNVVMLGFDPGDTQRLGPGWKLDYRIEYIQLTP